MCYPKPGPRCDTHVLTKLIDRLGLQRGRFNDENMEVRVELLVTRGGLQALGQVINECNDGERRNLLLAAYRTGHMNYASRMRKVGKVPRTLKCIPQGFETVEPERDVEQLQKVAFGLYGSSGAPLYDKARQIERKFISTTTGYTPAPGTGRVATLSTSSVADQMKIDSRTLPDKTVAYDIETDTSQGLGLQPHRTQITEMVLTDKERTVVLSGDEREILQAFADYMNSCPQGTQFVGWNNQGFDNPTLYVRGEHHAAHLQGWGMTLSAADQTSVYRPVGGYEVGQQMTWTTPEGVSHHDSDVMLTIRHSPTYRGKSLQLKPRAKEWGAEPIELDRERLHKYSQAQREAYVASDGVATLFNLGHHQHLLQERSESAQ